MMRNNKLLNIATVIIAINLLGLTLDKYKIVVLAGSLGAGFIGYRVAKMAEDCGKYIDDLD